MAVSLVQNFIFLYVSLFVSLNESESPCKYFTIYKVSWASSKQARTHARTPTHPPKVRSEPKCTQKFELGQRTPTVETNLKADLAHSNKTKDDVKHHTYCIHTLID